jgi:hypothetical protein
MDRMKTFLKYLIIFIAFYFLTDVLISIALANNYKPMQSEGINANGYDITVEDAKVTSVSGYISGKIKPNENSEKDKYMQIDFFSKYGNTLGRKYVDISSVKDEEKSFKTNFEYDDIGSYQISTTNEVESLSKVQTDMVSKGYFAINLIGILIVLYYVL